VSDLKALHEADASTRWCSVGTLVVVAPSGNTFDCYTKERAALIVALRNAYADGTLVERTPVGGERMSEAFFTCKPPATQTREGVDCPWRRGDDCAHTHITNCTWQVAKNTHVAINPERTPVGEERMSECGFILAQGESCPKCQERKPLDGYDWRSRWLTVVASVAVGTPQSDALYSLAAHIESLEAERDILADWCARFSYQYGGQTSKSTYLKRASEAIHTTVKTDTK
jgi:hypothetical protein